MNKPRVAVASLGGTITMTTTQPNGSGVRPSLGIDELLSAAPALAEVAQLEAKTLARMPGASLGFPEVLNALEWARNATLRGADGVVLVQGTDTLEETSYLLDLYWDRPEPLVVTGAMRPPQTPGADGPSNLLASVLVAGAPASRGLGALVVMNDEVHAASRVRKTRTSGVNAFTSSSFGPLGYVEERRPVFGNRPPRWPHLTPPSSHEPKRVVILETFLGDDGTLLDLVANAGFDGLVIAGLGAGHIPEGLTRSVDKAVQAGPVVLTSRAGSGTVFENTYDFIGSETDLLKRGLVSGGWLDARKARVLLSCLLSCNSTQSEISAEFSRRGGNPGGPLIVE